MASRRACLFCGSPGPLTKEHVFGRWLGRALRMGVDGPINLTMRDTTGQKRVVRTRKEFDEQIKQVCGPCNNGWSHDLERAFRAVMLPALTITDAVTLHHGSQTVVAVWAAKLWLLAELAYSHQTGTAVLAPGILRYLRERMEPPPLMQVWVGAVLRLEPGFTSVTNVTVQAVDGRLLGYLGVLTVGAVLFQVYAPTVPTPGKRHSIRPLTDGLLQIWPHEVEEVRWPPPAIFTTGDIRTIWPAGSTMLVVDD